MPELTPSSPHPASLTQQLLAPQCTVRRTRSTGPGGQHRNKTDSAVTLIHQPTGLSVTATERRSQHENLRIAYRRLRLKLAVEHRISVDPSQPPSDLWRSRVRSGRVVINTDHADFPTLLAEALDRLAVCQYDPTRAAETLGVSTSQFIKLLRKYPQALSLVNDHRHTLGLHRLK